MTDHTLLSLIPIDDIAKQLGVPESAARDAVEQAIPAIIGGMAVNAKDEGGAKSLERALTKHAAAPTRTAVKDIDTADGEKIVNNVFGVKKTEVAAAVASKSAAADVTQDLIAKVLPIIAPIVIAYIAKKFLGQKDAPASSTTSSSSTTGGGIGDVLGGLLGGSGGGDVLGGLLGGLLGGGKK